MNRSRTFKVFAALVADTFRQARSSGVFWLLLGASALCITLCLSVRIDGPRSLQPADEIELYGGDGRPLAGPDPAPGRMTLGFGALQVGLFRDGQSGIRFLHALLARWVAGAAGTLLVLVWTAGFLPAFLRPDAAVVVLTKPVSRSILLLGKAFGVLSIVALNATLFVAGTWAALGVRTGIWDAAYLWAIPLLVLNFAIAYGFSALIAAWTRHTVACVLGSALAWSVCFAANWGRHMAVALPSIAPQALPVPGRTLRVVEAVYWTLPKPADLLIVLDRAMHTSDHFAAPPEFAAVLRQGAFYPAWSVLASLAFTAALLAIAARQLGTTDY